MDSEEFKGYTFVFDVDGTLCPIKKKEERYEDLVPFSSMVEKLRWYKANGAKIVLYYIPQYEFIRGEPWTHQQGYRTDPSGLA